MGWIKVDRQIMNHWVWNDKPFSRGQAWIDLLLLANHDPEKFVWRGQLIDGKRGEVCRSIEILAERWGWSRKKTRRFIDGLQRNQMVSLNCTPQRTSIFISNYAKYQAKTTPKEHQKEQQKNSKRTAEEHQREHIQEYNTTYYKEPKEEKESAAAQTSPSAINPDDLPRDKNGCRPLTPEEMKTRMAKW